MLNTIGFLGCGNMGGAIARAVCKAADPQNVWLANRTAAKAEALAAELGCNTTINDEVAGRCFIRCYRIRMVSVLDLVEQLLMY